MKLLSSSYTIPVPDCHSNRHPV